MAKPQKERWVFSVFVAAALSLAGQEGQTSTFDVQTGQLTLDAALAYGFDGTSDDVEMTAVNWDFEPIDVEDSFVEDALGLEGAGWFQFGPGVAMGSLDFSSVADRFVGRRVEIRVWLHPQGTMPHLNLPYDLLEGSDYYRLSQVNFIPTGRATDDGWRELSTGPFDFAYGGIITPGPIEIVDFQIYLQRNALFEINESGFVLLDAFEVADLGPAAVPSMECTLAEEDDLCGVEGVCQYGRCVDMVHVMGSVPGQENSVRGDYIERRIFEIETYDAVRHAHGEDVAFSSLMRQAINGPVKTFWTTVGQAFETLVDGHAGPPSNVFIYPIQSGMCLYLSEADLLLDYAEPPLLPMVFSAESTVPTAGGLQPGDLLLQIDGLSVDSWRSNADRLFYYGGDPTGRAVMEAPELANAALQTGAVLTFGRCESVDGCSSDDLEIVTVDTANLVGTPIWQNQMPEAWNHHTHCDFRFTHAVPGDGSGGYHYAAYRYEGDVLFVEFNGVPYTGQGAGAAWATTISEALGAGNDLILLDERRGDGGVFEAIELLLRFLLESDDRHTIEVMPWYGELLDDDLLDELRGCYSNFHDCGYYFQITVPPWFVDNESAHSRVALLLGRDVSGNDFFTRSMQFREAETRFFGPAPTYGAFGGASQLPPYLAEYVGGGFQAGDSVFWRNPEPLDELLFESATGVPPDEIVFQRQSDAILGIDTTLVRAIQWLEEGE